MPGISRPKPIPSEDVNTQDVATATTVQLRAIGQATGQGAGLTLAVRTVTATGFISNQDSILLGNTTGGDVTLTLPRISEYPRNVWFAIRSTGANNFIIAARGSDTINGGASVTVTNMVFIYASSNAAWTATTIG